MCRPKYNRYLTGSHPSSLCETVQTDRKNNCFHFPGHNILSYAKIVQNSGI